MDMREQKFGIEIEMTGITRQRAAEVMAAYFSSVASYDGGSYEVYSVRDAAGRRWKVMYDSSIEAQKKGGGYAGSEYKVEFVSPICEYADIPVIQELIRQLRHAGAVAGKNTGIHVHINAAPHDARTLRNITNIMYSKEDLIYKALQVDVEREHRYCQKVEEDFLQELNRKKPKSLEEVSRIWYKGVDGRHRHYHESRYHCLNLHSVFQKGTIEFRLFNSTTHAGKIKAYIQLCLAISAQALNQKCASRIKTASTNEKYTFRTLSVSYTHLDVYKRQGYGTVTGTGSQRTIRQAVRQDAHRAMDTGRMMAVSYTHLQTAGGKQPHGTNPWQCVVPDSAQQ